MSSSETSRDRATTANQADSSPPDESVLTPTDAALFLGITPELLFAYVRYPVKKPLGDDRRLRAHQSPGSTVFRRSDLEAFDAYLKEPWSRSADRRPAIPDFIEHYLKVECGGQCARCGRGFKLETAHIKDYATSLSHHHHNLIRLCSGCHDEFDSKKIIPVGELRSLKQRLITDLRYRVAMARADSGTAASPPAAAVTFVGRAREVASIRAALQKRSRTICIHGSAGVGKTELALRLLSELGPEIDRVWLEVPSFKTVSDIEAYLRSALLKTTTSGSVSLAALLDNEPRCVIFDGVESITPVNLDLLQDWISGVIGATKATLFVFTSQTRLHSVDVEVNIELGPLNAEESMAILQPALDEMDSAARSHRQGADLIDSVEWLLTFCDGHALTLKLVSGLLTYFRDPALVVERIRKVGIPALDSPTRVSQTRRTSLSIALGLAYSFLANEERELAYIVSQYPAGFLARMSKFGGVLDIDAAIAGLRRWHLLNVYPYAGQLRVALSTPIRTFVEEAYELNDSAKAQAAFLEVARHLRIEARVLCHEHIQSENTAYGLQRFGHELGNYLHAFYKAYERRDEHKEFLETVGALASSMQVFCFVSGFWQRGAEIMRMGANASKQLGMASSASKLLLFCLILRTRTCHYSIEELAEIADQMNDLAAASNDPELLGNAAMANGHVCRARGDLSGAYEQCLAAEKHYRTVLSGADRVSGNEPHSQDPDLVAGTYGDCRHMLSLALMDQGFVLEHTARPTEAIAVYRQALALMEEDNDLINGAAVLHQTGNCECYLKNYEKALSAYLTAAVTFFQIGIRGHLSNSVGEIGYVLIAHETDRQIEDTLDESLLEACATDVALELSSAFFSPPGDSGFENARTAALRKLFGLVIVLSYAFRRQILQLLAETVREQILRPLVAGLRPSDKPRSMEEIQIMWLDVITAICGSVRAQRPQKAKMDRAARKEIEHLSRLSDRLCDAWNMFRAFDWLSLYLKRCYGLSVPAAAIAVAAEQCEASGTPFRLAGVTDSGSARRR
jgi:5-methylcytosine-specific restriction endonuclease McrA/tetratricopeptide (TPR) repeat protein